MAFVGRRRRLDRGRAHLERLRRIAVPVAEHSARDQKHDDREDLERSVDEAEVPEASPQPGAEFSLVLCAEDATV
jgi:hypothetical protein